MSAAEVAALDSCRLLVKRLKHNKAAANAVLSAIAWGYITPTEGLRRLQAL